MKTALINSVILILVMLSGCYSIKKSERHINRIHTEYPELTARKCLSFYPIQTWDSTTIQYIPGPVQYLPSDPVYVNCDSAVKKSKTDKSVNPEKIPVPVPPRTKQVDTVRIDTKKKEESTAMKTLYEYERDVRIRTEFDLQQKQRQARNRLWIIIAFTAYTAFRIFARFKLPVIHRFLP